MTQVRDSDLGGDVEPPRNVRPKKRLWLANASDWQTDWQRMRARAKKKSDVWFMLVLDIRSEEESCLVVVVGSLRLLVESFVELLSEKRTDDGFSLKMVR